MAKLRYGHPLRQAVRRFRGRLRQYASYKKKHWVGYPFVQSFKAWSKSRPIQARLSPGYHAALKARGGRESLNVLRHRRYFPRKK